MLIFYYCTNNKFKTIVDDLLSYYNIETRSDENYRKIKELVKSLKQYTPLNEHKHKCRHPQVASQTMSKAHHIKTHNNYIKHTKETILCGKCNNEKECIKHTKDIIICDNEKECTKHTKDIIICNNNGCTKHTKDIIICDRCNNKCGDNDKYCDKKSDDKKSDNKKECPKQHYDMDCKCEDKYNNDIFELNQVSGPNIYYHGTIYDYIVDGLTNYSQYYDANNIMKKSVMNPVNYTHMMKHFNYETVSFCNYIDSLKNQEIIAKTSKYNNKQLLSICDESTIYCSIFREAAGFDNSFGFYESKQIDWHNLSVSNPKTITKRVIYPSIKDLSGFGHYIGTFKNTKLGFCIMSDGNNKQIINNDLVRNFPEYNYYTNYEFNEINTLDKYKYRHKYIEQETLCKCHKNVKNYIIMFEDLSNPLYNYDGELIENPNLSFCNAILVITVIQNNNKDNTSRLID
jgi:hypothetical protein